jgi:hypothetical protein
MKTLASSVNTSLSVAEEVCAMLTELVNPSEELSTIALISSPSLLLPLEALVPILMHLLAVVFILY